MCSNPPPYSAPSILRIIHHTYVPPASVILRLAHGNDDIEGRQVLEEIFGGRSRIEIGDGGFDGVLDGVLGQAGISGTFAMYNPSSSCSMRTVKS